MPTIKQLIRNTRQPIKNVTKSPALRGCPQRRGTCTRVYVRLMTDLFSVLSIGSIITSHTLIFRKYRNKGIPRSNFQNGPEIRILSDSFWIENPMTWWFSFYRPNSSKFHPVKPMNYKSRE
ncbi:50S ribosomal protein L20 [Ranunculus cassubicifolius]